ncbi:hypothetical protein HMPREF1978_01870 [Actinomyces graevenitzii F0530]|uniref:Uncharacterized protein n=1 Tax=Actinomyces graevenitzii F0530 TaxID=1321817 RepID=U1PVU6_9ACTO|nr:hypothetical protein HMPREF1978_01870 [Actinomyces graevenitzii F0530]
MPAAPPNPGGVFPAHAGMSQPPAASPLRVGCFPRSRGDEPHTPQKPHLALLFSPLTRG